MPSDCETRALMKFLNVKGVTGLEIHCILSNVYGASNVMLVICETRTMMKQLLVCTLYSQKTVGSQFQTLTERWRSAT